MKILIVDSNHSILHETLISNGFSCDLFWDKSVNELKSILPNYDGLIIRSKFKIDKTLLENCPNLKCIGRVGAGMENIDLVYAKERGIVCLCVPEGNRDAVGEHALGMLLMLFNNLKKADKEIRQGKWLREENRGLELKGKTIGIIGFGNMGSSFAKKISGFDCKILAFDKYKTGFTNEFVKESTIQKIQDECDIISIHLPLTNETRFMINDSFIKGFKKNIYIINTARGKCLDTAALVESIKCGKVLGACLDVLEFESDSFEGFEENQLPEPLKYLIQSDKVILSPHIAGWTHESNFKMSELIAIKMLSVLKI